MSRSPSRLGLVLLLTLAAAATVRAEAPASAPLDFAHQVAPLLKKACAECHLGEENQGGLSLNTRDQLLRGGVSGPALVPGDGAGSLLIERITEADADLRMPLDQPPLKDEEITLLKRWIDDGAEWEAGFAFGDVFRRAPVAPRPVELPPARPEVPDHPIDRLLAPYLDEHQLTVAGTVDDRQFARRASLDLVGLLPTPERLEAFDRDGRPDKRDRLVDELLSDDGEYAAHWMTFWNDALRNAYRGTGFIDDGRRQITGWLYRSLLENKPYDQFVRELVDPVPESEGFTRGIVWRGVVNASQRPEMQAAQTISQVFLGTNLKCASCHDSFINDWTLSEAYALAGVFADEPLEMNHCDAPTGEFVPPAFLYPELGLIDAEASRDRRRQQLAELLTSPANGRLARTVVNRLWAALMGRGLIEPTDEMDRDPWNADLLDWLAWDLQEHGYDLKRTLRWIVTSRAYQLPADRDATPTDRPYVFRGPLVRRMSAEQFVDAVSRITGTWQPVTGEMSQRDGRGQGGQLAAVAATLVPAAPSVPFRGTWIWSEPEAAEAAAAGTIHLRRTFSLERVPRRVLAVAAGDRQFQLFVNGRGAAAGNDPQQPVAVDLAAFLEAGENVIAVRATNHTDRRRGPRGRREEEPRPAGWVFHAVGVEEWSQPPVWELLSDGTWLWAEKVPDNWTGRDVDVSGWQPASELGGPDAPPWNAASRLDATFAAAEQVRAVFALDDPLLAAMGRSNREQVVTRRDSVATTLQALELTNGYSLYQALQEGAAAWMSRGLEGDELVRLLYRTALGRQPSTEEADAARDLLGRPGTEVGLEDLLWALVMLPEFQLIY